MKKHFIVSVAFLLSLTTCKTLSSQKDPIEKNENQLQVTIAQNYSKGDTINIELTNLSGKTLLLYSPSKPKIEKLEQDNWKTIKILNCPCDAPCNAPPDKIELAVNKKTSWHWDQKESYCGKRDKAGIRETIKKEAEKGKYRLVTTYQIGGQIKVLYNEFNIN